MINISLKDAVSLESEDFMSLLEDPDQHLMEDTVSMDDYHQNPRDLEGEIHILIHPVYNIPCPFLRLWNRRNGEPLPSSEINSLLSAKTASLDGRLRSEDYRINERGRWYPDLHFYDQSHSYCTLHLCEIEKEYYQIVRSSAILNNEENNNSDNENTDQRKWLIWWSLIGKFLGITISPQQYQEILKAK